MAALAEVATVREAVAREREAVVRVEAADNACAVCVDDEGDADGEDDEGGGDDVSVGRANARPL